ncbi:hypothetical protein ACFVU3_31965 [Streptomyces sp. NPDC058052]|uniref:hypothetical protein n=1 Tax=Streptomyces sp. NPDC058052 TaxID=3346316 RepID=UPI0036E32A83
MSVLGTVAVLFLIVFGAAAYAIFHLKLTPVRIAAVLLALGALVTALVPIVRILAEPPQPPPPPAAAAVHVPAEHHGQEA